MPSRPFDSLPKFSRQQLLKETEMEMTLQVLVGLASLMLFGLGMMSMFAPKRMVANFALEPVGTAGLSSIRSVFGGLFLASVGLLVLGFVTGQTQSFIAVAILMGVVAAGRIVSLIADGFDKSVIPPLVVELVIASVLVVAHTQLGAS
jgi:DMSO reductase anchor subunit